MSTTTPVFLACLSLVAALARAQSDDVFAIGGEPRALLQLALAPEQTFAYRWTSTETTKLPQDSQDDSTKRKVRTTTLDTAFRMEKVANGRITLRCRFLRLTFDNPGAPEGFDKYDSDDPAAENGLVSSIAVLIGKSVLLDVDPTGKITGVSLGDLHAQIVKEMSEEARKRHEPPSVEETLREETNEAAIESLVRCVLPRLPGVAVGAGAKWTVDSTGKEPTALVCELKSLNNETAVIELGRERDASHLLDNMAGFMQAR